MRHALGGITSLAVFFTAASFFQTAMAADAATCASQEPILKTFTIIPYPTAAQRLDQTGTVMLTVTVWPDGTPTDAIITRSSGVERLDQAASSFTLSHYRWEKAAKDCPVSQQHITAVFQLGKPPKADGAVQVPIANYPADAIKRGEMGDTYLVLSLGKGGAITDVCMDYGSGFADLDNQAVTLAKTSPDLTAGKPSGPYVLLFRWRIPVGMNQTGGIIMTSNALHMRDAQAEFGR